MYYSWSTGNQAIEDFMDKAYRRHDISEHVWDQLEPHLPGRKGLWVVGPKIIVNLLMRCSGFFVQELLGAIYHQTMVGWSDTHRRFIRWRDKGIWESLLEKLVDNPITSKFTHMRQEQKAVTKIWAEQKGAQ